MSDLKHISDILPGVLADIPREPWGQVVIETDVRRCAYCDCAVCLESTGERSCSWCGARYRVVSGKPVRTDGWGGAEPSQEGT